MKAVPLAETVTGRAGSHCIDNNVLYLFSHGSNQNFDAKSYWPFFATFSCGFISLLLLTLYLWTDRSLIYAVDRHLFSIPVFRPIFTSTSKGLKSKLRFLKKKRIFKKISVSDSDFKPLFLLLLHRKREDDPDRKIRLKSDLKYKKMTRESTKSDFEDSNQTIPMLFICTTLWHEEENEMEQLLNSLVRLCCHNKVNF